MILSKNSKEGKGWIDLADFLGYEDPTWSPRKVKELVDFVVPFSAYKLYLKFSLFS